MPNGVRYLFSKLVIGNEVRNHMHPDEVKCARCQLYCSRSGSARTRLYPVRNILKSLTCRHISGRGATSSQRAQNLPVRSIERLIPDGIKEERKYFS